MVHFRLACWSRTAREYVLAELIFDVKVILHLVPDGRSLLPLVDKARILARQDCLGFIRAITMACFVLSLMKLF